MPEPAKPPYYRMPVILPPEAYDAWLPPAPPPAEAKPLLTPYAAAMIA